MFKYVCIPADASEPISIVKASKSGGLTNDELIKKARKYFIENTNKINQKKSDNNDTNKQSDSTSDIDSECLKRIELLEKATPQEKKQIADRIRTQYSKGGGNTVGVTAVEGGAAAVVTERMREDDGVSDEDRATLESKISTMDDDEVIQLLKLQEQQKMQQESSSSSSMTSCEITCLTIPTKLNQHTAVSMYGDDTARTKNYTFNTRATNLMTACGHAFPQNSSASSDGSPRNTVVMGGEEDGKPNGMYGDVFVGRSIDDETNDIWERVDLLPEEVGGGAPGTTSGGIATVSELNKIAWCKIAKKKGGGGGMGGGRGGSAPSLKNTIQKFQQAAMTEATSSVAATSSNSTPTITNVDDDGNDIHDEDELNYTWIQTNEELEMKFVVPLTTTTKQVQVKFGMKSLTVTLNNVVLCEGDLWDEIDVDGSTYTFQNENKSNQTKEICVSLEKHNQGQTWNYVIEC